jgi:leucyl/phenylalanyl-tRNA--protein transferase
VKKRPARPAILDDEADPFPDPRLYDAQGIVALGGSMTPDRLEAAYRSGIFPWYDETTVPIWWSPDPRALMTPERLHVSRSLQRTMRRGGYELTWNRCFSRVMRECAKDREDGTWILPEMVRAYSALQRRGNAHSIEVWSGEELVGGVYGVQFGRLFCAESMFHRATDMSKVALVTMVRALFGAGIRVFEVQFVTTHLASLGAFEISRTEYLQLARGASAEPLRLGDPLAGAPSREL